MGELRFEVLGPLRVTRDGLPVDTGPPRQRAVLVALLMRAAKVVTADELIDGLWADSPPSSARNIVHTYVSKLRQTLDPGREPRAAGTILRSEGLGYVLDVNLEQIDSHRFQRLVEEARQDRARAAGLIEEALGLWRGRALADAADEPFARAEADRLDEMRLGAEEILAEAELESGRHAELVPRLQSLVAQHPLRERLWGLYMLALYRSDRQGDALLAYGAACDELRTQLGVDPGPELRALHSAILANDPSLRAALRRGNLPVPASTFIGRAPELAEISDLLRTTRILTLVGAGGCGKTRLALRAASDLGEAFPDGIWWVDLAPIADPSLLAGAVASTLSPVQSVDLDALFHSLRAAELLLVADNCEHIVGSVAEVVSKLTRSCPAVRVLATSSQPLRVDGEVTFAVPPLSTPPERGGGDPLRYEAVQLFCERAAAVRAGFDPSTEDAESIASICRALDGVPLAIELAAARSRVLSVEEIARGLAARFRLLRGGPRDALARHRSLEASVEWSHELLEEDERDLLARLAVFAGSFDLDAAQAVSGHDLDVLSGLVEKSLVAADQSGPRARCRMLETIREFALEKLARSGSEAETKRRHLEHYAASVKAPSDLEPRGRLARFAPDLDNIRAAMDYAVASGGADKALQLAGRLWLLWYERGLWNEMRQRIEQALEATGSETATRMRALHGVAALCFNAGDLERALRFWREAADIAGDLSDPRSLARALAWLALTQILVDSGAAPRTIDEAQRVAEDCGDVTALSHVLTLQGMRGSPVENGYPLYGRAAELARNSGDALNLGFALHEHAVAAVLAGDLKEARIVLDEHLELARRVGNVFFEALALGELGNALTVEGDYGGAGRLLAESLAIHEATGAVQGKAITQRYLGWLLYARGDLSGARAHLDSALAAWRRMGNRLHLGWALWGLGDVAMARGELSRARSRYEEALEVSGCGGWLNGPQAWGRALVGLARVDAAEGRADDARAKTAEAVRHLSSWGLRVDLADALEAAAHIASAGERFDEGARLFGSAQSLRDEIGYKRFPVDGGADAFVR